MSVLLPIPGSPPTKCSEPGTNPPPSTRSSSRMPEVVRATFVVSTSASGRGADALAPEERAQLPRPPLLPREPLTRAPAAGASAAVFHASHDGQRPNQREVS